jgi:KDO2-lipid IV(A) lauroyltransferase
MFFISDLLIRLVTLCLRGMPVFMFQPVAGCLTGLAFRFSGRDNRILKSNIARVYHLPPDSHFSDMFRRQVFRHQVSATMETIRCSFDDRQLRMEGVEEFNRVLAAAADGPHGMVVITGHTGSWELCAKYCVRALPRAFNVLAKPSVNKAFTMFLERLRVRIGANVFWTDKKSLLKDMLGALKKREAVGFVMDQKPENRKGPVVEFFGIPTEFVAGPASMAVRTGAAVVSVFCMRTGPFSYRLLANMLAPPGHGLSDELALTQVMAREIESVIRAYPEQWTWNYKRWRQP